MGAEDLDHKELLELDAEGGVIRTTYTNDTGKFSITGLPAGRYSLNASKAP